MSKPLKTLTDEESEKLLLAMRTPTNTKPRIKDVHRNYTMTLLMLDAGLRVGEVTRLTRNCLMFAGEFCDKVAVPAGISKNKLERVIPTTERLQQAIRRMNSLFWQPDEIQLRERAFYTSRIARNVSVRQVQRIISTAGWQSLHFAVHPHTLRHTFATRLMRKTSIRVVQQLLGHKSITSTQIYTHPNGQDLKEAIDQLNGVSSESANTPSAEHS